MIILLTGKISKEQLFAMLVEILAIDIPLGLMVFTILKQI